MPRKPADDLTGRTYGDWTVTAFSHTDDEYTRWWHVRCECGAERANRESVLVKGKSTRCRGCNRRATIEMDINRRVARWVGTTSGGWVLVAYSESVQMPREKVTMWTCRCLTCGAVVDIPRTAIHKPTMPVCRHGVSPAPEKDED